QHVEADLCLVRTVPDHVGLEKPELPSPLHDRAETVGLNDVERLRSLAHAFIDGGGLINVVRGLAASNSLTTALATSSGEPARSRSSSQRQASRYSSMPVEPSFIAKASIAAWKRSGSIRFTSPLSSQALTCAGMCFQNITWYFAIKRPPRPARRAASRGRRARLGEPPVGARGSPRSPAHSRRGVRPGTAPDRADRCSSGSTR